MIGDGMDSAEAGQTGAAKNVSENGFCLIVGGVGHGDLGGEAVFDQLCEEGVAGAAGGVLEVGFVAFGFRGNVRASDVKRQREVRGQVGYEFLVGVRGATPQLVIEMGDAENDAQLRAQLEE